MVETSLSVQSGIFKTEEAIELELPPILSLPREHPAWHHDLLLLSDRAQLLFARLAPVVLTVLGFWDHAVRIVRFGEQCVLVDISGSYRLE